MNFKEECLKLYDDIGKRNETERKKRAEESLRRQRNQILKDFEKHFNRPFKQEYLIEEIDEYGYALFTIVMDEIKIRVLFNGDSGYYGNYYLLVLCHKCGKETTYRNRLNDSFLHNIGRILNENPLVSPYLRVCMDCAEAEKEKNREQRAKRYQKESKERGDDLFSKLADALAEVFRRAGYSEPYKDEGDYDYEG